MNARIVLAVSLLTSIPLVASCSGESAPDAATTQAQARGALRDWLHVDWTGPRPARAAVKLRGHRPAGTAAKKPSTDPPIPSKYQAFATEFEAETSAYGAPGSAVAILEHGEVTFAHGFGTKGPNSTAPVDAATLFRIGSMTKSLTATAALGLVDEGNGALDEHVPDLIPGVALGDPYAKHLTLGDLLSQQSELFDFTNFSPDPAVSSVSCPAGAPLDFVRGSQFAAAEFFMGPPRSSWEYSNTNFVVAGAAVESMSGKAYTHVMNSRVLGPLGMNRTLFDPSDVLADGDYTDGLSTNPDGTPWDVAPDAYDCQRYAPAGFAFSSVLDYARFVQFLYGGDHHVLSDGSRAAMQSAIVPEYSDGHVNSYGYGLSIMSGFPAGTPGGWYDTKFVTHGGAIPGFSSIFFFVPETGFGLVAFANADGAVPYNSIATAIASFSGLTATQTFPASAQPDAPTSPAYAGTFEDGSGLFGQFTVTDDAGTFGVSFPTLDALGITYQTTLTEYAKFGFITVVTGVPTSAESNELGHFLHPGLVLYLDFIPSGDGQFNQVTNGGYFPARRVAGP